MNFRQTLLASACASVLSFCAVVPFAHSATPDAVARDAFKALQAGQHEHAIALYTEAIESRGLVPEVLANALLNKALALQHLQKHPEAIAEYTSALELDAMAPQLRATVLYNRGLSHHKLRELPLAIEDYTGALLLNPSMAHAFLSRGNALRDSGQYLFALSDYERALRYEHPDPARAHYASALTFDALKRPKDAQKSLELALGANPNHTAARKMLELVAAKLAQTEQSDSMTTGSISAMGSTTLQKPPQAVAIEPQPILLNEPVQSADATATATSEPPVASQKIQDRLPEESQGAAAPTTIAGPETKPLAEELAAATASTAPVVETVEPAQPASVEQATLSGWTVQFASASSEEGAWSTWATMQSKHKVLRDVTPVVVRADLGAKGIFFRVRLGGFENQGDAKSTCQKMKRGGANCYVSKAAS